MDNIIIYRQRYLPASETFIYEQLLHFRKYRPLVYYTHLLEDAERFPYPELAPLPDLDSAVERIRENRVRLIYARFGTAGVKLLPLKRAAGVPMITSFHGFDVTKEVKKNRRYAGKLPKLFRIGERFTVVCEHMKSKLIGLGCPADKIAVVKSGIDLDKFPFLPKTSADAAKIRLLSIGRLTEKKGMHVLIEAFSQVAKTYPEAKLVIIGDGDEKPRLEALIRSLRLSGQVELKGKRSHRDVRAELEACDLFCLASLTPADGNEEGIPNAIIEASAIGRVVVSTRHAGIPELIEHGANGYLVRENDADELAAALLHAVKQQHNWRELVHRGRSKVEKEHEIRAQVGKVERLMSELLDAAGSS